MKAKCYTINKKGEIVEGIVIQKQRSTGDKFLGDTPFYGNVPAGTRLLRCNIKSGIRIIDRKRRNLIKPELSQEEKIENILFFSEKELREIKHKITRVDGFLYLVKRYSIFWASFDGNCTVFTVLNEKGEMKIVRDVYNASHLPMIFWEDFSNNPVHRDDL